MNPTKILARTDARIDDRIDALEVRVAALEAKYQQDLRIETIIHGDDTVEIVAHVRMRTKQQLDQLSEALGIMRDCLADPDGTSGKKITDGLNEALAWSQGQDTGAVLHTRTAPPADVLERVRELAADIADPSTLAKTAYYQRSGREILRLLGGATP